MDQPAENASWSLLSLLIPTNIFVRVISFVCLAIGLALFLPFALLVVLDFFLWVWRVYWNRFPPKNESTSNSRRNKPAPSTGRSGNENHKVD